MEKIQQLVNFSKLENILNENNSKKLILMIKNILINILNNNFNNFKLIKHPIGFYQLELLNTEKGTIRIHFYNEELIGTQIHTHGGDLASLVLNGEILNNFYSIEKILKNEIDKFDILEFLINYGKANIINNKKIEKITSNDLGIINIELINKVSQIYTKEEIKKFGVKYFLNSKYGGEISYPIEQVFLKEIEKKIFCTGDKYLIEKNIAHKAIMSKGSISIVLIEKNPTTNIGEEIIGGPYRQLNQEVDFIEKQKIIITNKDEIKKIILENLTSFKKI